MRYIAIKSLEETRANALSNITASFDAHNLTP